MIKVTTMTTLVVSVMVLVGCSNQKYEQGQQTLARTRHINCATAEADIRLLQHEKTHVDEQILAGVQSIVPASAVLGIVSGSETGNVEMGTGLYNKKIDERIAEIKAKCGIR